MLCPLCNGMADLESLCPSCGGELQNVGRPEDWIGPYSPYGGERGEPAYSSAAGRSVCRHQTWCPSCGLQTAIDVDAWTKPLT